MYRFALLRVQNSDVAEELVQEALVAALNARRSFSERSSERTWLIGILKHKLVDHFRATSARQRQLDESADAVEQATFNRRGLWDVRLARWSGNPATDAEKEDFWRVFRECMEHLPGSMNSAFCLRELEQMNSEEVCQVLGITPSNLWTQLHRARMRLRHCLEENWFKKPPRRRK